MSTTQNTITTEDGFIVDIETGEVISVIEPSFEERDRLVDWALKKRAEAFASAKGLEAEMNLLIAGIRERFETRIKEQERKGQWLESSYKTTIEAYAQDNIPSGKKSIKTTWATLSYKASRESTKILNEAEAVEFCKANAPDAVKTVESVLVSLIPDELKRSLPDCFEFHEAGETQVFTIN